MTENNTKLVKTCNTTHNVVKIVRIFSYVAVALFIFVAAASYFPIFDIETIIVENTITGETEYTRANMLVMGSYAVASLIIAGVVFLMCEKVLGTVKTESTPFVSENVTRIKTMAVLTALGGVIPSFFSQIVNFLTGGREIIMEVSLDALVVALVIWCVALIFEYGVNLQQREDETL